MSVRILAIAVVLLMVAGASAQQPKVEINGKEAVIEVTIRFQRAVIPVTVNGQGPYDFYYDPGSQGLGIEQSLVETLKLPPVAKASLKSGTGKGLGGSEVIAVEKLEFGGVTLTVSHAISFPRATFGGAGQPVGMLSPTLFPGYLVTLDYPRKAFKLQSGKLPAPDGKQVFAYVDRGAVPSVKTDIAGVAVDMQLDTNSNGGLSLPRSYIKRLPLMAPPVEAGKVRSDKGEFTFADATIKGMVKFGKFTFENPKVRFSDVIKRGNIGQDVLKDFAITIDIRQRRFRMEQTGQKEEK